MSDQISILAAPLATALAPPPELIEADGWWPAVDVAEIRRAYRIDQAISPERLREALIAGMAYCIGELTSWRAAREAEGYQSLAAVPAVQIEGVSVKVHAWRRAVASQAKSELVETMLDYDATASGTRALAATDPTILQLRRDAAHAIADIAGRARVRCELI